MKTIKPITGLIFPKGQLFSDFEKTEMQNGFVGLSNMLNVSYYYMIHQAEESELKEHCHFAVLPKQAKVDIKKVYDFLYNLKVMPLRTISQDKLGDFLLYTYHDKEYLATKGQDRKFHYTPYESKNNLDPSYLRHYENIAREELQNFRCLFQFVEGCKSFRELLESGKVNPSNLALVKTMFMETHYNDAK